MLLLSAVGFPCHHSGISQAHSLAVLKNGIRHGVIILSTVLLSVAEMRFMVFAVLPLLSCVGSVAGSDYAMPAVHKPVSPQ